MHFVDSKVKADFGNIFGSRTRTEVTHCKVYNIYSIYSIYYLGCGTLAACGVSLCCDLHQAVAVGNTAVPRRDDGALSTALSTEVQHSALCKPAGNFFLVAHFTLYDCFRLDSRAGAGVGMAWACNKQHTTNT